MHRFLRFANLSSLLDNCNRLCNFRYEYLMAPSKCLFWFISIDLAKWIISTLKWTFPVASVSSISLVFYFRFLDSAFSRLWFFLFWTFGFWTLFIWCLFGWWIWTRPRPRSRAWSWLGRTWWRRNSTLIRWTFWVSFWSFVILNDFSWHGLKINIILYIYFQM